MKAIVHDAYGTADVLRFEDVDMLAGRERSSSASARRAPSSATGTS